MTEYAGPNGGSAYIRGFWRCTIPAAKELVAVSGSSVKRPNGGRLRVFCQPFDWQVLGLQPTAMRWDVVDFLKEKNDPAAVAPELEVYVAPELGKETAALKERRKAREEKKETTGAKAAPRGK